MKPLYPNSNSKPTTRRGWVEYVLAHKWVMSDSRAPMAVTLGGRNDIAIGAYRTTLRAMIAARPNARWIHGLNFA